MLIYEMPFKCPLEMQFPKKGIVFIENKGYFYGMKILFIGEIVGRAGIKTVKEVLPPLKEELHLDFVVANGNGTTGGFGMGKNHAIRLNKLGMDILTSGECVYYKKDMLPFIGKAPFMLRPANYPPGSPGRGWGVFEKDGKKLGVINLLGLSGYERVHLSNPFSYVGELIKKVREQTPHILINFHALPTAEKKTMAALVDGKVSAMMGTGAKALTADAQISAKGSGTITDAGRSGALYSVGGLLPEIEIRKFLTQLPERSKDAETPGELQGVFLELDAQGKAIAIKTLKCPYSGEDQ